MRIEHVHCQNYKSIRDGRLENLQRLNILIGKNNSGKSNLLKAIRAFFEYANPANLATIVPPSDVDRDLYRDNDDAATKRASITVTLALDESEISQLISDIADESPQVKNALSDLSARTLLRVTIAINAEPSMAYVESIDLVNGDDEDRRTTILNVSIDAASELRKRAMDIRQYELEVRSLEVAKANVEDAFVRNPREDPYRSRSYLRRQHMRSDLRDEVSRVLDSSPDANSARQSLNELVAQRNDLAETRRRAPLSTELTTFAGAENTIPSYVTNLLDRVVAWSVLYLDETRKPVGPTEARRLLSLKMRRGGDANLRAIQSAVSSLLRVQIDAFESNSQPRLGESEPLAEMDVDDFLVELNGSGIRESLRLILDVNFEDPKALLLEEPEVHLHPALEYSLLQFLKDQSEHRQIFITTHSTNFLDTAGESRIYLVSKDGETKVSAMDVEEFGEHIPRELGVRLSSVFMFDRLVFVEGPSDELILRELASKLDLNLAMSGVGFVQTNGARAFTHFANATTLDILSKRQVKATFLLDRDERTDADIESMRKLCDGKARLHVLRKREIENYLLAPEAICALIELKSEGRQAPTVDAVKSMLSDAVKGLHDTTVVRNFLHKTCKPVYFDRQSLKQHDLDAIVDGMSNEVERMVNALEGMRETLSSAFESSVTEVGSKWDTSAADITPGADVIDSVMKNFGLRYQKTTDGARLAKLLPRDRIDKELHAALHQIVNG